MKFKLSIALIEKGEYSGKSIKVTMIGLVGSVQRWEWRRLWARFYASKENAVGVRLVKHTRLQFRVIVHLP